MIRIGQILALCCLALLNTSTASNATTLAKPIMVLHDLKQQGSQLLVTGNDAYLITRPHSDSQSAAFIELALRISSNTTERSTLRMELFFKPLAQSANSTSSVTLFDPLYRIQFFVNKDTLLDDSGVFLLPLPESMELADLSLVRLDIDGCAGCSIELLSHPKFLSTPSSELRSIKPNRTLNGIKEVDFDGFKIPVADWTLNDLERDATGFVATGEDPYLISPYLDFATTNLGGVFIQLKALSKTSSPLDFQLFYATEAHGFIEAASISERIHFKGEPDLVFVIPMPFLSEELPARKELERIRLDLPGDKAAKWQLTNVTILSKQQLKENQHWIPQQIVSAKLQRASNRALLKRSVTKLLSDLGFLLSYLALIITTALLFWRAYRK